MRALLLRYPREENNAETVRTILGAFPAVDRRGSARELSSNYHALSRLGSRGLAEPLSERELEVLRLLRAGMSDKEIAGKMFITVSTVKRHTATIYGKLGVHNRTDAVVLAESLGILAPG
jgi:LuxR family maltose regulon positive regulatory protein